MKKKAVSFIIVFVFAILGFIFFRRHISELKQIFEVNLKYIIILLFLRLFFYFLGGVEFKTGLKLYNLNLKFKEWWGLTFVVAFGNYLTPFKAGFSSVAVYLKKKYSFPYTSSVGLTGILYLVEFLILGFFGLFFAYFTPLSREFRYSLMLIFVIIIFSTILILFFLPSPIRINLKVIKHVANAVNEFKKARNLSFMLKMIFLVTLRAMTLAFSFYFAFKAFNFNVPISTCVFIVVFSELSLIISITPMGLGIRESVIIIISKLTGGSILIGTFVAALDRVVGIVIAFVLGPIFSYLLFKKWKKE